MDPFFAVVVIAIIGLGIAIVVKGIWESETSNNTGQTKNSPPSPSRRIDQDVYNNATYRVIDEPIELDNDNMFEALQFQMRGLIPISDNLFCSNCDKIYSYQDKYCTACGTTVGVTIAVSIFDDEKRLPFICHIDSFQENNSRAYLYLRKLGNIQKGYYYPDWTTVGFAVKESLIPPKSGVTKLRVVYRFLEIGIESQINGGFIDRNNNRHVYASIAVPGAKESDVTVDLNVDGFLDLGENSKIAHKQALRLGIELALVDGEMHGAENDVINEWLRKYVESFQGQERVKIEDEMYKTMQQGYKESTSKILNTEKIIKQLLAVGKKADYRETMELLVDIMAADKEAHKDELNFINKIGDSLGIPAVDIQNMKGVQFFKNQGLQFSQIHSDQILGINPNTMTKSEICGHLRSEFVKWNSRIQGVKEVEQREKVQKMMDVISEARAKYCG